MAAHVDTADLAHRLLTQACKRDLTLVIAESCTGGLIGSMLTDVEGLSHAFERGFIVYTDAAKAEMLGVEHALLAHEGAVSKAAALAMALGALARSHADVALAVTGFAGPAGPGDEIGLVHIVCARRGHEPVHRENHFGCVGRDAVREAAARMALTMAIDAIAA